MKLLKQEQKEKNVVYVEFELDNAAFEAAMERSYKKNVKSINLPGFRKGHAPRKMIEKAYGEAVFYDDAINFAFPEEYGKLLEETKLDPVDRPEVDIISIGEGKPVVLSANITVRPEVTLGEYKGVSAVKEAAAVSDEDVDAQIKTMQERQSRMITLEGGEEAASGDTVTLDYAGTVDGVAFEGGTAQGQSLELGSGTFIPGFEDQLIGIKAGESRDVKVTFPEEYHAKELAGKDAVFACTVHEIKRKELPALDDEFAKDVSEFDTLDELKADIKKKTLENREKSAQNAFENAVIEAVCNNAEVDIPACMIDDQIDKNMEDMDYRFRSQGLDLDTYMKYTGMTLDTLREQLRPEAEKAVKASLVIEAVAKAEKIEVTDEDTEKEVEEIAKMYDMEVEKVKEIIDPSLDGVQHDILMKKTIAFLAGNAKAEGGEKPKKTAAKKTAAKKAEEGDEKPKKTTRKAAEADGEEKPKKTVAKKTAAKKAEDGEEKKPAAKKTTKKAEKKDEE